MVLKDKSSSLSEPVDFNKLLMTVKKQKREFPGGVVA